MVLLDIMSEKTIKLYDENAYSTEFTAKVVSCEKVEDKEGLFKVVLDRTLFFPEEGGQTPDKGIIIPFSDEESASFEEHGTIPESVSAGKGAAIEVQDVQIKNDVIFHFVTSELKAHSVVFGRIDFGHRFSNMQQHSGEHIFSGIVNSKFGYDNVGFHLSDSIVTMDYSGQLSPEEISDIELSVNQAIYENREIRAFYPSPEELSDIDYRSKKELIGAVRIVEVDGYDVCACCAPHVKRTGEIGILKVVSFQNYKGGTRVSILCGKRALEFLSGEHSMIQELAGELSTSGDNIPTIVHKQQEEIASLKRSLSEAGEKLLNIEADKLPEGVKNVCLFADKDSDPNVIRRVVNRLVSERAGFCGIFFGNEADGFRFIIGSGDGLNSNDIIAELKKSFNVRGGGKPAMVQGSIEGASEEAIREVFNMVS
ncbi:alanyl-tRNA editing protein [Butyrivibrio sp. VCD2006]|uniref:alanyl-tRNA editing protein n=1 Tax=Butyrivibrio sp. VCD2006 TaxID=1280664 RepID=UPI001FA70A3D|nr:DHHA1 domain-containing protein [Butyrivibrio sp. VCD2006]